MFVQSLYPNRLLPYFGRLARSISAPFGLPPLGLPPIDSDHAKCRITSLMRYTSVVGHCRLSKVLLKQQRHRLCQPLSLQVPLGADLFV